MKKILITGANGLLGQAIASHFERHTDAELLLTGIGRRRFIGRSKYISLDITSEAAVSATIKELKPEIIINNAGMSSVEECEKHKGKAFSINVSPIEYLANAANEVNSLIIHLSTELIFDGSQKIIDETSTPHPLNYYGWSKYMSEVKLQALCKKYNIVRCSHIYGYNPNTSRSNLPLWVYNSLKEGKNISVASDQWRTPVFINDVVNVIEKLCASDLIGIFQVAGQDFLSLYEAAVLTANIFNLDESFISPIKSENLKLVGNRPEKLHISTEKIEKLFNHKPTSFENGVLKMRNEIIRDISLKQYSEL